MFYLLEPWCGKYFPLLLLLLLLFPVVAAVGVAVVVAVAVPAALLEEVNCRSHTLIEGL